ncbi:MAG TPA: hypothetical protein VIP51_13405 [Eoetvoesiella sp.]
MDPLSSLLGRLASLPSYWKPSLAQLSSKCEKEGRTLSLRALLFAMRDMPYGRPVGDINGARECITQWRGTCSAKHFAAYELLDTLGLSPKLWLACYQLDLTKTYYSDEIRARAESRQIYDVHNYLTCELNGSIKIIDITFPSSLGIYGLPVTESWTGKEDFVLCCDPEERRHVGRIKDADRVKRDWLRSLNSREALGLREQAIHELMHVAKRS